MKIGSARVELTREGEIFLVMVIGITLAIIGAGFNLPGVLVAGLILWGAAVLCKWFMRPHCQGMVQWHGTEDGEIHIGICNSCDRWQIYIRDTPVALGRGFEEFEAAMERAIQTNQAYLPHLSARLREVLDSLEKPPAPEEGFGLERDG